MDRTLEWKIFYTVRMGAALSAYALLVAMERFRAGRPGTSEGAAPDGSGPLATDVSRR